MKVLFLIPSLRQGGAEKVLVNLVNHMDKNKFDISIKTIFEEGENVQFLHKNIDYSGKFKKVFRGNKQLMKLFSPKTLYKLFVGKEKYDVVVAYLEGPATRIVAGCQDHNTKLVAWVHIEQKNLKAAKDSYRSEKELKASYSRYHRIIAVSETVKEDFASVLGINEDRIDVLYNTNDTEQILNRCNESISEEIMSHSEFNLISMGRITQQKGFDRLARIHARLRKEGYPIHTYILGIGPQQSQIEEIIRELGVEQSFTFLGYDTNPYKYLKRSDLFVCSSIAEGFSTSATEALIVGTPVCTVEVSGMKEMLGSNGEYGIVTKNNEDSLYEGIKNLLDDPLLLKYYRRQAAIRGKSFDTNSTVSAVEKMFKSLLK